MQLPYIPADIPFTGDQKAWLAGFLAGINTRIAMPAGAPPAGVPVGGTATVDAAAPGGIPLQIVYGSQTGTAEWLSEQAEALAREHGFEPVRCDLDALDITALSAVRRLLVITSTYGEGDMPDNAELFWQALAAPDAPRLDGLYFGVLALGDSIYDGFCQAGKNIDARLAELGGTRVVDRVDCDVDFEDPATDWIGRAVPALAAVDVGAIEVGADEVGPAPLSVAGPAAAAATTAPTGPAPRTKSPWTRKNPYSATVVANTLLSAPTSDKEVRHLEISLGDSGIDYQPGDGISISPVNDDELVDRIITRLGVSPDTVITDRKVERSLREALTEHYEISTPSKYLLDYIAQRSQDAELIHLTSNGDREALDAWMWGKDVLDLLDVDPTLTISPEELIAELRPLQHRVYSISSSPLAHAGTVHITMATVRYRSGDRQRGGVCSTFLADRRPEGTQVGVFISPNNSFRLPPDDTKTIMIGPGTGIAPFRSFLHERAARGARGGNWLFFGDRRRAHDHIYADEIDGFVTDGILDRLDLAFSRDQEHKIYVQDRIREQGADLFGWLSDGAHVYVCGDATRMARDVDTALRDVVAEHGGLSDDAAQDYLDDLKRAKRYLRDVY
ncbi:sulfite reductase subunit alpha [Gordonia sp. ABSL11-1]|uniref:sulfite reductase subunit alpha n=1 Tax=Gordonia sp. ABSL11-1 TaxID=3053924 RepID=UPI002572C0FD|nr:sulfite reductase subunit alpha [Gordonia sp. ABSL11-1]MDL9946043.1 sulfite reductase subunit alpha [Gordonia sp. ABSL11-1]